MGYHIKLNLNIFQRTVKQTFWTKIQITAVKDKDRNIKDDLCKRFQLLKKS